MAANITATALVTAVGTAPVTAVITDYIDAKKFKINGKARARVGGE